MSLLVFSDGREIDGGECGGERVIWRDRDAGKEYTFSLPPGATTTDRYVESSVRKLVWYGCARGHGWWSEDRGPDVECGDCKRFAEVLGRISGSAT